MASTGAERDRNRQHLARQIRHDRLQRDRRRAELFCAARMRKNAMLTDQEMERLVRVSAEMRAQELVRCLRHAVQGEPHWRFEAATLLALIDSGVTEDRHG